MSHDIQTRLRENADLDEMEHCNPDVVALEREAADHIEALERKLAERQAPEGFAIVPLKPTPEMMHAGIIAMDYHILMAPAQMNRTVRAAVCYQSMIAVAPSVGQTRESAEGVKDEEDF